MNKSKYIAVFFQFFLIILIFILIFYNWDNIANIYSDPLIESSSKTNENPLNILPAPC